MNFLTTTAEAVLGLPSTPDFVLGPVSTAARILHALLKARGRWWLITPLVRKVIAARRALRQAWDVVGLERSFP